MQRWRRVIVTTALATASVAGCTVTMQAASDSQAGAATAARTVASTTASGRASGAAVPSPGCSGSGSTGVASSINEQRTTLTVDGTPRWYLLTAPPEAVTEDSTPQPLPLVLDFHGLDEGAQIQATMSQFGSLALEEGFVVAFPNGTGSPIQWDTSATSRSNHDLDFIRAMLTSIEASRCIDLSRVYADGFSDGAYLVSLLACTMSDQFAAIAAVSGLQMPVPCKPTHRMPILTFHGTADPILHFNGGVGTSYLGQVLKGQASYATVHLPKANLEGPGVPATVKAWAVKDGCSTHFVDTQVASKVIRRTYPCPAGTGVTFYIVEGGGHAWPGSAFSASIARLTGPTTFEINATDTIWAFFRHYRLPSVH